MTKTIALLGSTGSIGRQTLQVARGLKLRVAALAAGSSVELLEAQAREFSPRLAVLYDKDAAAELRQRLRDTDIEVLRGRRACWRRHRRRKPTPWSPPWWAAWDWNPRWRPSVWDGASPLPTRRRWCAPVSW